MEQGMQDQQMSPAMMRTHYRRLGLNLLLSFIIMYLVMFSMIYSFGEFFNNLNFFYMALMMASPMGVLMLLFMGSMYKDKKLNVIIHVVSVLLFVVGFIGIRTQALVGDNQFLRSMIPHHSGAVLMCERAKISDPEVQSLCGRIIQSQKEEVDQMEQILKRR